MTASAHAVDLDGHGAYSFLDGAPRRKERVLAAERGSSARRAPITTRRRLVRARARRAAAARVASEAGYSPVALSNDEATRA